MLESKLLSEYNFVCRLAYQPRMNKFMAIPCVQLKTNDIIE